jgi:HEPN domain-containing protein
MSSSKKLLPAMTRFRGALAYKISAERLHELFTEKPQTGIPLSDPVYFLYHQAAELALKACLMSHGLNPPKEHSVGLLFERRRAAHLLAEDKDSEMHNLMVLLDAKKKGIDYRYADHASHGIAFVAGLTWVQEGVAKLISDIETRLRAWGKDHNIPGPWDPYTVMNLRFALDKPTYTRQPKPSRPGP